MCLAKKLYPWIKGGDSAGAWLWSWGCAHSLPSPQDSTEL